MFARTLTLPSAIRGCSLCPRFLAHEGGRASPRALCRLALGRSSKGCSRGRSRSLRPFEGCSRGRSRSLRPFEGVLYALDSWLMREGERPREPVSHGANSRASTRCSRGRSRSLGMRRLVFVNTRCVLVLSAARGDGNRVVRLRRTHRARVAHQQPEVGGDARVLSTNRGLSLRYLAALSTWMRTRGSRQARGCYESSCQQSLHCLLLLLSHQCIRFDAEAPLPASGEGWGGVLQDLCPRFLAHEAGLGS